MVTAGPELLRRARPACLLESPQKSPLAIGSLRNWRYGLGFWRVDGTRPRLDGAKRSPCVARSGSWSQDLQGLVDNGGVDETRTRARQRQNRQEFPGLRRARRKSSRPKVFGLRPSRANSSRFERPNP